MIATKELQLTIEGAQEIANAYISTAFDEAYFTYGGKEVEGGYHFMVACKRADMTRDPAVGSVRVLESGDVETLSDDRIRDMKEAAEVQAAQERGELARDEEGVLLRRHARIKANSWTTHHIDHKVGARGGIFIPAETPIWRFSIKDSVIGTGDEPLDVIDVDANTGDVLPLTKDQIGTILGGLKSIRKVVMNPPSSQQNGSKTSGSTHSHSKHNGATTELLGEA